MSVQFSHLDKCRTQFFILIVVYLKYKVKVCYSVILSNVVIQITRKTLCCPWPARTPTCCIVLRCVVLCCVVLHCVVLFVGGELTAAPGLPELSPSQRSTPAAGRFGAQQQQQGESPCSLNGRLPVPVPVEPVVPVVPAELVVPVVLELCWMAAPPAPLSQPPRVR